jgi:nitrile hydratase beta subunit
VNAVHDVGGLLHFGPIDMDGGSNHAFHHEWHGRVFAMFISVFVAGYFSFDEARHEIEKLDPDFYANSDYYERWLRMIETVLERRQVFAQTDHEPPATVLTKDLVAGVMGSPTSFRATVDTAPRFQVGDRVRVRDFDTVGHTRVPRYVRGRTGIVARSDGGYKVSDFRVVPGESPPQNLYNVRFMATELWDNAASALDSLHIELWECHIEPA